MASAMVSHHPEIPMSIRRKFEDLKNLICKLALLDLPSDVHELRSRVENEKMKERKQKQALEVLEKIKADLQVKYPHLNVSFGYIGNLERWGDDRSWRFFYNPEAAMPAKSFGGYSTDGLPKFAEYMQATGLEVFGKLLGSIPIETTGWVCKGSMKLGTGCGQCIRCLDELAGS